MTRCVISVLAVMLTACTMGGSNTSPQAECERQADSDPKVVEIYTRTNGDYTYPWVQRDDLLMYKAQAVMRCMRAKGLAPPGGVQPVVPR